MEGTLSASCQKHQHSAGDTSPTSDTTMKHGQMSPTANPTTPSKGASRGGTPEPPLPVPSDKHAKRDAYKAQKRTYRSQKKEAAKELLSTITDPAVVLLGDWLKVRGTLKSWTKLWCVLKPGLLILYKSDKHKGSQWVGTILLNTCQLLERPSKKDGFCFKLFHPLDQSIWATKGPKGETIGAFVQPLPYSYCIFRAPSESAGKCWMDALELALKCTSLLKRSLTRLDSASDTTVDYNSKHLLPQSGVSWPAGAAGEEGPGCQNNTGQDHSNDAFTHSYSSMRAQEGSMDDSDLERHFANQGVDRVSEADKNVAKQRGGRGHGSLLDSDRSPRGPMLCPKCRSSTPELAHYSKGGKSPSITYKLGKKSCPISDSPSIKIPVSSDNVSCKETDHNTDMTQKPQRASEGSSWDNPGVSRGSDLQKTVMHGHDGEKSQSVKDSSQLKNFSVGFQKSSGVEEKSGQRMSDTSKRIAWKSSMDSDETHQESPPLSSPVDVKIASLKASLLKFRSLLPRSLSLLPRSVQSLPALHHSRDRLLSVLNSTAAKPGVHAVTYAPRQMSGQGKGEHATSGFTRQDIQDNRYSLSASSMKMAVDTEVSNAIPPSPPKNLPVSLHQPLSSDALHQISVRLDKIPNSISSLTNRLPGRGNSITNVDQPLGSDEPHLFSAGLPEIRSPLTKAETSPGRARVETRPEIAIAETKPEAASLISSPSFERMLQSKRNQLKKVGCLHFEHDPVKEDKKPESTLLSSTEFVVGESSAKTVSPSPCSSYAPSSLSLCSQSWKEKSMYSISDAKHKKPVYFISDGKRSPTCNESISSSKELRTCPGGKSPERGFSFSQSPRSSTHGDCGQQEWQAKGEGTVRQKILKFSQSADHSCALHCSCLKTRYKHHIAHTVEQGTQTSDHGIHQYSDGSRPGSGDKKSVQLLSVLKKTDFAPLSPVPLMQNMLYTLADTDSDSQSQYTTVSSESQSSQSVSDETGSAANSKSGLDANQTSEGSQTTAESDSGESSSSSSGSERSDPKSKSSPKTEKKTVKKKKAARKDADPHSQASQTSMSDSPRGTSVVKSHKAGSAGVEPSESQTSTDYNTSASSSPSKSAAGTTRRRKVFPGNTFAGNRSFSNSSRQPGKIDTRVQRGRKVLVYRRKGQTDDRSDSKRRKKSGSRSSLHRADGGEGGEGKKQKKKAKSASGSSSGSGGKSGDEGGKKKKKKKKKKKHAAEGEKSGEEGEKQKDKEGGKGEPEKSGDDAHHKKKKKKKKKKKHAAEGEKSGEEGEKQKDKEGGEGESSHDAHKKKKKKKKKKHGAEGDKEEKSGAEGEQKKDKEEGEGESGEGAKKKKKKKEEGEAGSTEKADHTAPEGGEGHKKKKKKKKKKEGEAGGETSESDAGGGKKKKKKKKKKEGEAGGETSESDAGGGKKKKKKKKKKEGEAGGETSGSDAGGGKKKKKKKKKKEGEAGGETSGSDAGGGKKKKKKKKKKEGEAGEDEEEIESIADPHPIPPSAPEVVTPSSTAVDVKPSFQQGETEFLDNAGGGKKKKKKKKKKEGEAGEDEEEIESIADPHPIPPSAPEVVTPSSTAVDVKPSFQQGETEFLDNAGGGKKKKKKKKKKEGEAGEDEEEIESIADPHPIPPSAPEVVTPSSTAVDVKPSFQQGETEFLHNATDNDLPESVPVAPPIHVEEKPVTATVQENLVSDIASVSQLVSSTSLSQAAPSLSATTTSSPAVSTTTEYMEQVTSTSENEDIVYEMPFFLQNYEAWRDSGEPKVDHFKSMSDLSQLCPKCVEALKKQGLTDELFGHVGDSGGASGPPIFVSQKFKMIPKDDAKYSSEPPGAASSEEPSSVGMLPSHAGPAHGISCGLDEDKSEQEDTESSQSEFEEDVRPGREVFHPPDETTYLVNRQEELGQRGDECQTEEVNEENKGLIWTLVKQVRPGMDLSKVVLPTFILEPRSFLDKLSDYYYHADILSEAVMEENPYSRIKSVVKWYLSGFYKKPKGLKKPYNPVIGEVFRCCWHHPATGSRTFYVSEQVSHHPPVSVFHVTNRKDGFNISGSILARSKFYGNSLSAFLDGVATLSFLERGEDYFITMPYAHCKGILIGTLTMELGGKVTIDCPKTGYKCELDFKLKPFLGSGQASNRIHGKILMGSDLLASIDGHWDQIIYIKDRALDKKREVFWDPTPEVRARRLRRCTVALADQCPYESERLWEKVSKAVVTSDMQAATNEKYVIEEEQRKNARDRKLNKTEWVPRYFEKDYLSGGDWIYRHADDRPWDSVNDVYQYENSFVIQTQTRHKTPHLRANSITSVNKNMEKKKLHLPLCVEESDSSGHGLHRESDSSDYRVSRGCAGGKPVKMTPESMSQMLLPLVRTQQETSKALRSLQQHMARLDRQLSGDGGEMQGQNLMTTSWLMLAVMLMLQVFLQWIFR